MSSGFNFGSLINLASLFTGFSGVTGLLTGGWGWAVGWFVKTLLFNGLFSSLFGFHGGYGGYGYGPGYGVHSAWMHDPGHRWGVPYPTQALATRYHGNFGSSYGRSFSAGARFERSISFQ